MLVENTSASKQLIMHSWVVHKWAVLQDNEYCRDYAHVNNLRTQS